MLAGLIRLARPKDWLKNVFVIMPLPFALAAGASLDAVPFLLGLLAMCLASSATYALNDTRDAEADRSNPRKRDRPVAAGVVPPRVALVFAAVLAAAALELAFATGRPLASVLIVVYLAANLVYSLGGKNVPLFDVFLLSSGYVLRVFLGCALLAVAASNWLLLCSSTLALFMALTKRRGDLLDGVDPEHRPSLRGYNMQFLDQAMGITAGTALVSYALYSIEADVFVPGREFASLPFVAFVILDYLRIAHTEGEGASPVDLVFRPAFVLAGAGWAVAAGWSLGIY
ncbi:MAG: UbiA prenyltransferase family protein [Deltaproteobacteria bacterium]|nr:UbiA prenyltransferase family protein [Deltaproteobacteria bacterium]MBW2415190.1 UbiA prenyltransferase family protein [Deltaproteobacteria bacterium]